MSPLSLPFDGVAGLVRDLIDRFVPDPAQKLAAAQHALDAQLQLATQGTFAERADAQAIAGQVAIDQAEASSSGSLAHWRSGLGWVCVFGYAWNFAALPLFSSAAILAGHPVTLPTLELGALSALTVGMLGLGGLHVAERIGTK